ncbi:hypothetical protein [Stenotrophomonas maltophilia]|uniref:hypothetical protein n=1 Tax=Stenotrophomonas maltophilia TaxID=40324 RepID=UPI0021C87A8A|nr:hypothetical protein [Stenotrophomonas maltophilia]MCU1114361.1 hypothetical protein [Stenotrophomonas maltophilia]MCU1139250.1 hypothetical protein [Stenotrophomonas maltophilia]
MSNLSGAALDTLIALVEEGPLWDGDLPSKRGRTELLDLGMAVCIVVKGQDGYQAATYAGRVAYCAHFGEERMADAKAARVAGRAITNAIHRSREQ